MTLMTIYFMVMKGERSNIFSANDVRSIQSSLRTLLMFLCSVLRARRNILTWKVILLDNKESRYHIKFAGDLSSKSKNCDLSYMSVQKRLNTMGKTLRYRQDRQKFCCTQYFMFVKIKREFKMCG